MPPIQWITAGVALLIAIVCLLRLKLTPSKRLIRIPVLLVMVHVLVFYVFVALKDFGIYTIPNMSLDFSGWSSILRFHSLLTYALIETYGYWRDKTWKNQP